MSFSSSHIPYSATRSFSSIAVDYVTDVEGLKPFYQHPSSLGGVTAAIEMRKRFNTDRMLLVEQLKQQYNGLVPQEKVIANIERLLQPNTFTITTAHQPNIFTGHLYFIYKILHTIRLAEWLSKELPENNFVPVYYMGSEDADLEELGQVTISGKKYVWDTPQTGAVGRMKIDKGFLAIMDGIEAQLTVEPFGHEVIALLKKAYTVGKTIEAATFDVVHELFADYGLIVLLPDNALLKKAFAPVIQRELAEQFSNKAVEATMQSFPSDYKLQTGGRAVNLFHLQDGMRERIERGEGKWTVVNTNTTFDDDTMLQELKDHPERFSPNVVLRPVFQEFILPNIIFVGGGGELGYWLELKKVFDAVDVPYPVLILRNSFMIVSQKERDLMTSLVMEEADFFKSSLELSEQVVKKYSRLKLSLDEERSRLRALYCHVETAAGEVDPTLIKHVAALRTGALKRIEELEKKMLKAEKKKFEAKLRHVEKIKKSLFPNGSLQERVDNFMPYYARYGKSFLEALYQNSLALEQQFSILVEKNKKPA